MILRLVLAVLHLLALGIGLGAVHVRARALSTGTRAGADVALRADTYWALAAAIWLATGLYRAFGGVEKGADYYLDSHTFLTKMALFLAIWALEIWPMITLIRWRRAIGRGSEPDLRHALTLGRISHVQTALALAMVALAAAMARGY